MKNHRTFLLVLGVLLFVLYFIIVPNLQGLSLVEYWIKNLTLDEKIKLVHGSALVYSYTGYVPGIDRLRIPSLRMNDGPQGFRGPKQTSTAWPCGLSMASTFDPLLVKTIAKATGKEFLMKGANVFLGPGMNLARIPENGRNFEYLCGEDPFLGEVMAVSFTEGIQSNPGLIAMAKHFVNNDQETHRTTVSSIVDEETEWNMYYRPFLASVKAGIGAVMCSYNKINGAQGCASLSTMRKDLENRMGFSGMIVSDWFATQDMVESAYGGLDIEMPVPIHFGDPFKKAIQQGVIPESILDEKVRRILNVIVKYNLGNSQSEDYNPKNNVTSLEHSKLARMAVASSVILLKNEKNLLPLEYKNCRPKNILVLGDRGDKSVLSTGGGSGHVSPPYVISPFQGLKNSGNNKHHFSYYNTKESMELSKEALKEADIIFIIVGTVSFEGKDRENLSLNDEDLNLIEFVSTLNENIIISITSPGAIRIPFWDSARAILLQFLPGQEAGNGLADVVFGFVDPGGARLPITLPLIENERQFTQEQYPGINDQVFYTEKTEIGYRWYATHPLASPRLSFGAGLSYAEFKFLGFTIQKNSESFAIQGWSFELLKTAWILCSTNLCHIFPERGSESCCSHFTCWLSQARNFSKRNCDH